MWALASIALTEAVTTSGDAQPRETLPEATPDDARDGIERAAVANPHPERFNAEPRQWLERRIR